MEKLTHKQIHFIDNSIDTNRYNIVTKILQSASYNFHQIKYIKMHSMPM